MWLQQLHHFERFVGGWLKQPGHIPRDAGSHLGTLELVGEAHGQLLEFLGVSLVGPWESFGGFLERVFGGLGGSVGGSWGSLGVPAWSPLTCENVQNLLFLFSFERLEVLRGALGLSGCSPNHASGLWGTLGRYLETMWRHLGLRLQDICFCQASQNTLHNNKRNWGVINLMSGSDWCDRCSHIATVDSTSSQPLLPNQRQLH